MVVVVEGKKETAELGQQRVPAFFYHRQRYISVYVRTSTIGRNEYVASAGASSVFV